MARIVKSIKRCVVTDCAADIRVAWLVHLACFHSHALRAYRIFESKQANLITRFGRRPNNENDDFYDPHELTL